MRKLEAMHEPAARETTVDELRPPSVPPQDAAEYDAKQQQATWDHGVIARSMAEARLRGAGLVDGLFLLRRKDTGASVLSYTRHGSIEHVPVERHQDGYRVGDEYLSSVRNVAELVAQLREREDGEFRVPCEWRGDDGGGDSAHSDSDSADGDAGRRPTVPVHWLWDEDAMMML